MYTIDPINSYRNQYYYNNFRSAKQQENDNNLCKPVAVTTNDNRVNFGEHEATPFLSKLADFTKKLVTGDVKTDKDTFVPYLA